MGLNDQNRYKGGRPKGSVSDATKKIQEMKKELVRAVRKEFKPMLKAQIEKAKGVIIGKAANGKVIYKDLGPDTLAFKQLVEQAIGKPKEFVEVSGQMTLTQLVTDLEKDDPKPKTISGVDK